MSGWELPALFAALLLGLVALVVKLAASAAKAKVDRDHAALDTKKTKESEDVANMAPPGAGSIRSYWDRMRKR